MTEEKLYCEQAVLGAMLIDAAALHFAQNFMESRHFSRSAHKKIFDACVAAQAESGAADLILVTEKLKAQGFLAEAGGERYLGELMGKVSTTAHIEHYAAEVKKAFFKSRQLKAAEDFGAGAGDAEALIKKISAAAAEIALIENKNALPLKEIGAQMLSDFDNPASQIHIGFRMIDDNTPVEPGDLIVIGGGTAVGKSLMVVNLIKAMSEVAPARRFLVYTTEMTPKHFLKRQTALYTGVPYWVIKSRKFNLEQVAKINNFVREFTEENNEKIYYSKNLSPALADIETEIKRTKPTAVFLDNLSGAKLADNQKNKADNIGDFVRGLKRVCMENNCIAIVVCHLRRDANIKAGEEPQLHHLKDSSAIEETGTHVILLWGKQKETPDELGRPKEINWAMAKDRDGTAGAGSRGIVRLNRTTLEITED